MQLLSALSLDAQPFVPTTTGIFKHIASGKNGKLFVLYEVATNDQYILTGNPPIAEALVVKLNPQSLNLGSKGNWYDMPDSRFLHMI